MATDQISEQIALHRKLGATRPPDGITQEAFEGDVRHLRRLTRLLPGDRADATDLWEYVQDLRYLRYTQVQGPLFVYLLPFCLQALRDDLRGFHGGHGGLIEHLYPVLADQRVFDQCLNDDQREAASEFIRQAILMCAAKPIWPCMMVPKPPPSFRKSSIIAGL